MIKKQYTTCLLKNFCEVIKSKTFPSFSPEHSFFFLQHYDTAIISQKLKLLLKNSNAEKSANRN